MMVIPGSSDSNTILGLLAVISDPVLAKQNLDDLSKASSDLNEKLQSFQDLTAKQNALIKAQSDLDAKTADIQTQWDTYSSTKSNLEAQLAKLNQDKSDLANSQAASKTDLDTQMAALDAREASVAQREIAVDSNISKTTAELSDAKALKQSYQDKLNQLKSLTD